MGPGFERPGVGFGLLVGGAVSQSAWLHILGRRVPEVVLAHYWAQLGLKSPGVVSSPVVSGARSQDSLLGSLELMLVH